MPPSHSHSESSSQSLSLSQLLEVSGAILRGHFKLTSGRHSDVYFEKFRILERPEVLSILCNEIADHFRDERIDYVAGPTTGGIIIAFEVGRQLGLPARYIESENGKKLLRRRASIPTGARVLVVDDILTTGLSLVETHQAVEEIGATVIGYGVLIDRSQDFISSVPLFAAHRVEAISYSEGEVPDWLAQIPIEKPGTRQPK